MVDSSAVVVLEGSVWVRTAAGWRRAFQRFPATLDGPAMWEISSRELENGLHDLTLIADGEVGEVIFTAPTWRPTRREQCEAVHAQALADVASARARLSARAPAGWEPREP
jgi:hypothetical protein